jgi:hypothetical protein
MIINAVHRWLVLFSGHLQLLSLHRWTIEDISFAATIALDFLKMNLSEPNPPLTSIALAGLHNINRKQKHVHVVQAAIKPDSEMFWPDSFIPSMSRK